MASRFGRKFVHLPGCTEGDVARICQSNGINNVKQQKTIFEECEPTSTFINNQNIKVVHDIRRIRRIVERELMKTPVAA